MEYATNPATATHARQKLLTLNTTSLPIDDLRELTSVTVANVTASDRFRSSTNTRRGTIQRAARSYASAECWAKGDRRGCAGLQSSERGRLRLVRRSPGKQLIPDTSAFGRVKKAVNAEGKRF